MEDLMDFGKAAQEQQLFEADQLEEYDFGARVQEWDQQAPAIFCPRCWSGAKAEEELGGVCRDCDVQLTDAALAAELAGEREFFLTREGALDYC